MLLPSHASISIVSLSGSLASLINLKEPEKLQLFMALIKDFDIPKDLKEDAQKIGLPEPDLIRTVRRPLRFAD